MPLSARIPPIPNTVNMRLTKTIMARLVARNRRILIRVTPGSEIRVVYVGVSPSFQVCPRARLGLQLWAPGAH